MPENDQLTQLQQQVEELTKAVELLKIHQHLDVDGSLAFQGETSFKGKEIVLGGGVMKGNNTRVVMPLSITDGVNQDWLKPKGGQRLAGLGIQVAANKGEANEQLVFLQAVMKPGAALTTDQDLPTDQVDWNDTAQILGRMILEPQGSANISGPSVFPAFGFVTFERTPLVYSSGSITQGGSTLTDSDAKFIENAFVGCILVMYNAAGAIAEAHTIISNTANVITIGRYNSLGVPTAGAFLSASGSYNYGVRTPVFLGSADIPLSRVYVGEDIRLGYGASGGTQVRYIKWGNGSPEGVVTANIGSLYLRLDGSTSTTLYVKTANNGSATGWTAK